MGLCATMQAPSNGVVSPVTKKVEAPPEPMVVQVDKAIARRGSLSVSGRYTCSRKLEDDYFFENKVLGSGMSGPVLLASSKRDGRQYAVKSFKKRGLSGKNRAELQNEVEVYLTLDHPHVAKLEMVFETEEVLHLVMEYMAGGELYDRLAARRQYSEEMAAETSCQILRAVAYLHAHKIAHRDLKLENFLYEKKDNEHLKLIDFGFAKFWDPNTMMSQSCGSLHYVAPEVLAHSYTTQADMWSVGVLVYMLLTGVPLFHGTDEEILRSIKGCKPRFSSRFFKLSNEAQAFVRCLLVRDPSLRFSASAALEHPWIDKRARSSDTYIDTDILQNLRSFARASHFRKAVLSMMAWSLSADDIAELREQFLVLDTQKKGTITHRELRRVLEERFRISGEEARLLFLSMDTDNNEQIEYTEFLAAALVGRVRAHEDVLRKTFARFDRTQTGHISTNDLRLILGKGFEREDIEEIIREVDTSGDGKIDYDEFIAFIHQDLASPRSSPRKARSGRKQTTQRLGQVIDSIIETEGCAAVQHEASVGSAASEKRKRLASSSPQRHCREAPPQPELPVLLNSVHKSVGRGQDLGKPSKAPR